MKLSSYLAEHNVSDADFAMKVGVDRSTITRLRGGSQIPSAKVMAEIARVTEGNVTANDFFGIERPAPTPAQSAALTDRAA